MTTLIDGCCSDVLSYNDEHAFLPCFDKEESARRIVAGKTFQVIMMVQLDLAYWYYLDFVHLISFLNVLF